MYRYRYPAFLGCFSWEMKKQRHKLKLELKITLLLAQDSSEQNPLSDEYEWFITGTGGYHVRSRGRLSRHRGPILKKCYILQNKKEPVTLPSNKDLFLWPGLKVFKIRHWWTIYIRFAASLRYIEADIVYLLIEYLRGAESLPQLDLLQGDLLHTGVQLGHLQHIAVKNHED